MIRVVPPLPYLKFKCRIVFLLVWSLVTMARELNQSCNFTICWMEKEVDLCISQSAKGTQTALIRIWTQFADSILWVYNNHTTYASNCNYTSRSLVMFYGISTFVGYLMSNPVDTYTGCGSKIWNNFLIF